jgi:hypothetical protein
MSGGDSISQIPGAIYDEHWEYEYQCTDCGEVCESRASESRVGSCHKCGGKLVKTGRCRKAYKVGT